MQRLKSHNFLAAAPSRCFYDIKHLVHCECFGSVVLQYVLSIKEELPGTNQVEVVEVVNAVVDVCHGCVVVHASMDIAIGPGWFVCI